jgi:hypothetical protein
MVGGGGNWSIHRQWQISTLTLNKRKCTMKQYKVVDDRNMYRNDPTCEIRHDNEKAFVMNKTETDKAVNLKLPRETVRLIDILAKTGNRPRANQIRHLLITHPDVIAVGKE